MMDLDVPVIGIVRGVGGDFFRQMMPASFGAGLQAIEVTMNTENAERIIAENRPFVPKGCWLGAGTVRNLPEARQAADAGAMFFVTPNLDVSVIAYASDRNIPVIAGALTPTEVYTAWSAGAAMVKVFPCAPFGPQYLKDLRGPFDQIDLVAVGGVNLENLSQYFAVGARAVGVSTNLFGKTALANEDIEALTRNVRQFIHRCMACGKSAK